MVNPTENPEPPTPPVGNPTPSVDESIPTPQRLDAGFGGATGSSKAAGVALIGAALLLALLVLVIARRRHSETGSTR